MKRALRCHDFGSGREASRSQYVDIGKASDKAMGQKPSALMMSLNIQMVAPGLRPKSALTLSAGLAISTYGLRRPSRHRRFLARNARVFHCVRDSLHDKTIAILEARLGRQFAELIEKRGGRPLHAPALAEVPDLDREAIARLVADLETVPPAVAIFQTGVGTRALFEATDALGLTGRLLALLAKATVAVRGPKPAGALRSRGVRMDLSANDPFTTAEVLEMLAQTPISGRRVVVQRYGVTNAELDEALKARGAAVIEIPTYRWSLPQDTRPLVELMDALDQHRVGAARRHQRSPDLQPVRSRGQYGRADALRAGLNGTLVASVGPVSSDALKKFGVTVGLEASPPKLGPLISALEDALKILRYFRSKIRGD